MPGIWRIAADWLNEPLGGARLRDLPSARTRRLQRPGRRGPETGEAVEAVEAFDERDVAEAEPSAARLATITIELHLRRDLEAPGDLLDVEALRALDREQDGISAWARERAREHLGPAADARLERLQSGSAIAQFAVSSTGAVPAGAAGALDALTAHLREFLRDFLGTVAWATGTWQPGPALAPPPPAPAAPERGDLQIAKWLLGGVAFLGACLAALKVSDTDLQHARLNYPWLLAVLLGVIVTGSLVAVLWPAWQARADVRRWVMFWLTAAAILVGAAAMTIVGITNKALSHTIRPRIATTLTTTGGVAHLTGTVTTDGIQNKQAVAVTIWGVPDKGPPEPVFTSTTGADRDGAASVALDASIDSSRYSSVTVAATADKGARRDPLKDCAVLEGHTACLALPLRPRGARPRLTAVWQIGKGGRRALAIHATASGLSRADRVLLSIREPVRPGSRDGAPGRLYAATWVPDESGAVDEKLTVPVGASKRRLCVVLRGLPATAAPASKDASYGPCGDRRRGVSVMVGRPPV